MSAADKMLQSTIPNPTLFIGTTHLLEKGVIKGLGCGYFLATMKPAKNQVILSNGAAAMTGNSRVIEVNEEYPRV